MDVDGWGRLAEAMRAAGEALRQADDAVDRADGERALLRAVNNLLGRIENRSDKPELVPFNGSREKFFMDNPHYRYWITDVHESGTYRIAGNVGDSVYQSLTVYAGAGMADTAAVARIDTDELDVDVNGGFSVTLSSTRVDDAPWLELPRGATSLWVRLVHNTDDPLRPGACRIDTLASDAPQQSADLGKDLARTAKFISFLPQAFSLAVAEDVQQANSIRRWSAMAGGAAFTEPGIHYLRGAWQLGPQEALVVEGDLVSCRHWNIVLYNRFLNSLDYRRHVIARTASNSTLSGGRFRFVVAADDPDVPGYDWLDTERRPFGLFVMRFLQPVVEPHLPEVRLVALADLRECR